MYGTYDILNHDGTGVVYGYRLDASGSTTTGNVYGLYIGGPLAMENYIGGNTGIGIINPVNRLDVEGAAVIGAIYSGTNTAPSNGLLVYGNVGIGTTAPTNNLSVNGSAGKTGGGAWSVFSDERIKQNITNYNEGLDLIEKLHIVNFQYNDIYFDLFGENESVRNKVYQGVIAQELRKIAPDMVSESRVIEKDKEGNIIKDKTILEVDPSKFTYTLINAIKEQQKMIDELKKEIEELKNK